MHSRPAFTVVEMLVALVVFSVAALGTAATLTFSLRERAHATARREAVAATQLYAATLAATTCAAITGGTTVINGVSLSWTVSATDSIVALAITAAHRGVSATLRTEVACE